jgi:hypothetical protein
MSDGTVQLQPDSTGKKVDVSELVRGDSASTTVERQRAVLADNCDVSAQGFAGVRDGALQVSDRHSQLLESIDEKLGLLLFILENAVKL